ncbi:MAG: hypothetical protein AVO38_03055 [delta proteobacterium ML8_D]|nr:MAG: hypothetical protein AVO38_03055 [delta proteobacterium ML8_D]
MKMIKGKRHLVIFILAIMLFWSCSSVWAAVTYETCHNPASDVFVDSNHPYSFELDLPGWDFDKGHYTVATLELTYENQWGLPIKVYAADPDNPGTYDIFLGAIPNNTYGASGTETFDLLSGLSEADFNSLFQDQSILYAQTNCHYYFDKACLHLETISTPIPGSVLLLGSGLLGLIGLGRRRMR